MQKKWSEGYKSNWDKIGTWICAAWFLFAFLILLLTLVGMFVCPSCHRNW
jgi:hypothetical protein